MDRIRRFERKDIEQVANLHRSVFNLDIKGPIDRHHSYFSDQFLSSGRNALPSLVSETQQGRILGFLGVTARHFSFGRQKITAALSSQFVVHPEGRRRLTAIHLLRKFLSGPQDLSFTDEANEVSRQIWVALGGSVSTLQGIHWIVPLRPFQLACHRFAPHWIGTMIGGAAGILDRLAASMPRSPFRTGGTGLQSEPLSIDAMLAGAKEMTSRYEIRPHYERPGLTALLDHARDKKTYGLLRGVLLKDERNQVAGWYWYQCKIGGLAEVLQITSREDHGQQVVAQLASDAKSQGAIAIVGRLEPGLSDPLANRFCLLFRRKYDMLIHSRSPEILNAIHSGRAFISRLEGEWCLRFA